MSGATLSSGTVNIEANRRGRKWTAQELVGRALWSFCNPLFRLSPRVLWGWRRLLLRMFGATVGRGVHVYPTVKIAIPWNLHLGDFSSIGDRARIYNLGTVTIGSASTISHGAHLCAGTHDYRRLDFPLIKSSIHIGDGAWICSDAFVGPDVTVGSHAIVGACAVAMRDVPQWTIVAGNPAKFIGTRPPLAAT